MSSDLGVLYRDYLPQDLAPILDRVDKTVLVQASNSLTETDWLLSLADDYEVIAAVAVYSDVRDVRIRRAVEREGLTGLRDADVDRVVGVVAVDLVEPRIPFDHGRGQESAAL